jgi:hypothetical protein
VERGAIGNWKQAGSTIGRMRRARYSANFLAASELEEERTRVGRTEEAKALRERYRGLRSLSPHEAPSCLANKSAGARVGSKKA